MNTLMRRAMLGTVVAGGLLGLGQAAASADATTVTTDPSAVITAPAAVTTSPLTAVTAPVLTLTAPTSATTGAVVADTSTGADTDSGSTTGTVSSLRAVSDPALTLRAPTGAATGSTGSTGTGTGGLTAVTAPVLTLTAPTSATTGAVVEDTDSGSTTGTAGSLKAVSDPALTLGAPTGATTGSTLADEGLLGGIETGSQDGSGTDADGSALPASGLVQGLLGSPGLILGQGITMPAVSVQGAAGGEDQATGTGTPSTTAGTNFAVTPAQAAVGPFGFGIASGAGTLAGPTVEMAPGSGQAMGPLPAIGMGGSLPKAAAGTQTNAPYAAPQAAQGAQAPGMCPASLARNVGDSLSLTLAMLLAAFGLLLGAGAGLGTGLLLRRRTAIATA